MIRAVRYASLLAAVTALASLLWSGPGPAGIDMAAKALARDPDIALRLTTRTLTFSGLGSLSDEETARAHAIRAEAAWRLGRLDYARRELDAALAFRPDDPSLLFLRGKWSLDAGECAKAARDYDKALAAAPRESGTPRIATHLARAARAHACAGDSSTSAALLDKASALDGGNAEVFFARSVVLEKAGDKAGALQAMERAWNLRTVREGRSAFFQTREGGVWLERLVKLRMDNGADPLAGLDAPGDSR